MNSADNYNYGDDATYRDYDDSEVEDEYDLTERQEDAINEDVANTNSDYDDADNDDAADDGMPATMTKLTMTMMTMTKAMMATTTNMMTTMKPACGDNSDDPIADDVQSCS